MCGRKLPAAMSLLHVRAAIAAARLLHHVVYPEPRAVAVAPRRLRQVPCPATATLNQPPNWGGLSSISSNWREWRKREGDGAPQEPKGAGIWPAPLLRPLVVFYLAASRPCLGRGMSGGKAAQTAARSLQVTGHSPGYWSGRGWKGFQLPLGASGNAADRLAGRSLGGKQVG